MKKKVTLILCSLMMILLIGCGGKSQTLVGAWTSNADGKIDFELFSDGTGVENEELGSFPLEWIAENGKLKITINAGFVSLAESFSYQLSDDTLILTTDEGEETTFTRVKESKNTTEDITNDLSELIEVDPFEYITIEYEGENYLGEVKKIHNNATDEFLSQLSFGIDYEKKILLANGDKIKIYIDSKNVEANAAKNNYVLTQTEKEYIVEGLPHYITLLSDIPSDITDELQEKAYEDIKTLLENNIMYQEYADADIEFIGNYLWTRNSVSPTYGNYYYFIYKVSAALDQEKVTFYYYKCFHDLFMDENENLLVDLEQSGSGLDITEPHPGYESIETLENYLTERYGDTHTCDCNIIK